MLKKLLLFVMLVGLTLPACSFFQFSTGSIRGSGHTTTESRSASDFNAISLEGSADVNVTFGPNEGLTVEADDNLLPYIETVVRNNQLVIRTRPGTSITTTNPVRVNVTMKALEDLSLRGSGSITAPGYSGTALTVSLPGSGDITVNGTADQVKISLSGSGNVNLNDLKAKAATVSLNGSGNVSVNASESLDASITGSGNIRYSGNPAKVTKVVRGSGTIQQ